ncbi:ArsR/SmtB family transcription factor [Brucella anthropi]|uniref:ArsR/SmtB family transcription factor n=1 Tax=Brucella anthropi TaxID=529 RepID=UPI0006869B4A|nr:ArsR family transcriptional regulator [Brucella anthropi]
MLNKGREIEASSSEYSLDFDIQEFCHLCYLLSSETRAKLIFALAKREMKVGDLSALVSMSSSAVSQHLKLLREVSAVETRRERQEIYYRLISGPLKVLLERLNIVTLEA